MRTFLRKNEAYEKFSEIVDDLNGTLNGFLKTLIRSEYIDRNDLKNINGIYVFYENDKPVYVGRTNKNRMRKRIQEHSRLSSNKNSASFAFLLYNYNKKNKQKEVEVYNPDFLKAKERISKMKIKILEINDPIIQTILEPYIAFKLETTSKHNKFITH